MVLDDFNVILEAKEKSGGLPFDIRKSESFSAFMDDNLLVDMGFSRSQYSWTHNQNGTARILKRLDQVLVSQAWDGSGCCASQSFWVRSFTFISFIDCLFRFWVLNHFVSCIVGSVILDSCL